MKTVAVNIVKALNNWLKYKRIEHFKALYKYTPEKENNKEKLFMTMPTAHTLTPLYLSHCLFAIILAL